MYHPLLRLTFLFRAPLCIWLVVLLLSSALCLFQRITLGSRTPGKRFYSFLLLVFHLPPLHPLSSLSLDYHGSGFELSLLFFSGHQLVSNLPLLQCQTPLLLFFSLLALPEFSNYPSPAKDMFGILSFSWGLGVNKGAELCDCV